MLDFCGLFSFRLDDILAAWSHLEENVANRAFYPIERGGAPAGLRGHWLFVWWMSSSQDPEQPRRGRHAVSTS